MADVTAAFLLVALRGGRRQHDGVPCPVWPCAGGLKEADAAACAVAGGNDACAAAAGGASCHRVDLGPKLHASGKKVKLMHASPSSPLVRVVVVRLVVPSCASWSWLPLARARRVVAALDLSRGTWHVTALVVVGRRGRHVHVARGSGGGGTCGEVM